MSKLAILELPKPAREKRQRGRYGAGRVYLRGNTYWIQFYADGQQVRESSGSDKASVAEEMLHEKMTAAKSGEVLKRNQTYEQFREALYDDYETHKHKSLLRHADGSRYIGPVPALDEFFKEWKVKDITTAALKDFIKARRAARASNSNINQALRLLRRMFWLQVEENHFPQGLVPHFPMLDADPAREDFLSDAEFQKVLAGLNEDIAPLAIVGFNTGARRGELLKLRWADVNLAEGFLTFRDTKNGTDRDVPIIGEAREALEALRKKHPTSDLVFVRDDGKPIKNFRRSWENAVTKAKLKGRKFHGMRRGMAVRLMEAGIDSQMARKITGHRDAATFERYRVLQRAAILQAGKALEAKGRKR
jgi:integrase